MAKNLNYFDPPKQKLNNLTVTNLYYVCIKLDDVMTTSERYNDVFVRYLFFQLFDAEPTKFCLSRHMTS